MHSLAELGITPYQTQNIIMQLTQRNYSSGPTEDRSYPNHNIWIFGYNLDGEEIYIKLSDNFDCNFAKCISFHKAGSPVSYPYKNIGE